MRVAFHHIAYQTLQVCNALSLERVESAVARAGLPTSFRALDIGCAYGEVSIHLARAFDAQVTAVELDPVMANGAEARIAAADVAGRVTVRRETSIETLRALPPFDLIVAIGTTDPAGGGLKDPAVVFAALSDHLTPGGALLWGDLFWKAEPPEPLRLLVESAGTYVGHEAWQAAGRAAGLDVVSAEITGESEWATYRSGMETSIADWLDAHPDHPDAPSVAASAHRVKLMFDFGEPFLGFGLYLFRKP